MKVVASKRNNENFFWEFGKLITRKSRVKVQCVLMTSSPAPGQKTAFFGEFWRFSRFSVISCASMKIAIE